MSLSSFLRSNSANSPSLTSSSASNTRPKTSGLWNYATDVDKEGNPPRNSKGKLIWRCGKCPEGAKRREYNMEGGNAHFREHLWKVHGIVAPASAEASAADDAAQLRINMAGWNSGMRVGVKRIRTSSNDLNQGVLRAAFRDWIAADNLPFKIARSSSFRVFLELINPIANQMLPRSNITVRNNLIRAVRLRRPDIKRALASARSKIHLIVDV